MVHYRAEGFLRVSRISGVVPDGQQTAGNQHRAQKQTRSSRRCQQGLHRDQLGTLIGVLSLLIPTDHNCDLVGFARYSGVVFVPRGSRLLSHLHGHADCI